MKPKNILRQSDPLYILTDRDKIERNKVLPLKIINVMKISAIIR